MRKPKGIIYQLKPSDGFWTSRDDRVQKVRDTKDSFPEILESVLDHTDDARRIIIYNENGTVNTVLQKGFIDLFRK